LGYHDLAGHRTLELVGSDQVPLDISQACGDQLVEDFIAGVHGVI
jgi:hypothetical protein